MTVILSRHLHFFHYVYLFFLSFAFFSFHFLPLWNPPTRKTLSGQDIILQNHSLCNRFNVKHYSSNTLLFALQPTNFLNPPKANIFWHKYCSAGKKKKFFWNFNWVGFVIWVYLVVSPLNKNWQLPFSFHAIHYFTFCEKLFFCKNLCQ